jgi:hypothetical protein
MFKKSKAVLLHHAGAKGKRRNSSYSFLTLAIDEGQWVSDMPQPCFTPGMDLGTHWIGG